MTTWHRLKTGDARVAYGEARERGEAHAYAAAWKLAVLEGVLQPGDAYRWGGLDGETSVMRAAVQGNLGASAVPGPGLPRSSCCSVA